MIFIFFLLFSCTHAGKNIEPVNGKPATGKQPRSGYAYDLSHPLRKWKLPPALLEISGNSWIDKDHLMVIEDLHPDLYLLNLKDNVAVIEKTIPFKKDESGKKFDVEDVVVENNIAYALWSHGSVYKITNWKDQPQVKKIKTFLSKENNTEGICYDPVSKNLLVACKNNADQNDEKKSTRAVYQYDIKSDSLLTQPFMLIHKKDFKKFLGEKEDFYPSAIAVSPVTNDVYILSTKKTKCMAVFAHDGSLKKFELLDKTLLPQPEGMCFAPDGTLYISTEGKAGNSAYILEFAVKSN